MAGPTPSPTQAAGRYLLALRPAPAARRALGTLAHDIAKRCGGRAIGADDIHLTIVFVGRASRTLEPSLREAANALPAAGNLRLSRFGSFGPRLLWIGPDETPVWLARISDELRADLDHRQIAFDRKAFRPHVTLVRGARANARTVLDELQAGLSAVDFGLSRTQLVESLPRTDGVRYRWLDRQVS